MCAAASSPGPDCRLSCSTVLPAPLLEQPRRLWERREEKGRVGPCSQCSVSGKQSRAWPLVGAGGGLLAQKGQMLVIIEENIQPSPPNEPPGSFFPCDSPFSCSGGCPRGAGEARGAPTPSSATRVGSAGSGGSGIGQGLEGRPKCCRIFVLRAKFEPSLTMDLCQKSQNIPGSHSSKREPAGRGGFVCAPKASTQSPRLGVSRGSRSPALPEPGTAAGSAWVWEFTPTARCLSWNSCLCLPQVPSESFLPGAVCSAAPFSTHRQAERGLRKKTKPKAFESFPGWSWVTHRSTSPARGRGPCPQLLISSAPAYSADAQCKGWYQSSLQLCQLQAKRISLQDV